MSGAIKANGTAQATATTLDVNMPGRQGLRRVEHLVPAQSCSDMTVAVNTVVFVHAQGALDLVASVARVSWSATHCGGSGLAHMLWGALPWTLRSFERVILSETFWLVDFSESGTAPLATCKLMTSAAKHCMGRTERRDHQCQ